MEASALHAPAGIGRLALTPGFLRLRSDDQLVALFRAGNDDAFAVIHDRYRQRLFAYVRQMMGAGSRQDAEDVMQDVFIRAYGALRSDDRPILLRAWLYRVAHNRCIDVLRRPVPAPADVFEMSRKPLHDPIEESQRREDLRRLVRDVSGLPDQQRSALLMREIDGMPYSEIAEALDVTVPAVKSLLVRARMGLVEAQEARDMDCSLVREDLLGSYDRGVKASGRAKRHMKECSACREYRGALRSMKRSFAALSPVSLGPIALVAKALGIGGAGGGAAAGAGGGGTVVVAASGATACKVAAVMCTAAITAGGAVEIERHVRSTPRPAAPAATAAAPTAADPQSPARLAAAVHSAAAPDALRRASEQAAADRTRPAAAPEPVLDTRAPVDAAVPAGDESVAQTGGTAAPVEEPAGTVDPAAVPGDGTGDGAAGAPTADGAGAAEPTPPAGGEGDGEPGSGQH